MEHNAYQELLLHGQDDLYRKLLSGEVVIKGDFFNLRYLPFSVNKMTDCGIRYNPQKSFEKAKSNYDFATIALEDFLKFIEAQDYFPELETEFRFLDSEVNPYSLSKKHDGFNFDSRLEVVPVSQLGRSYQSRLYIPMFEGLDVNLKGTFPSTSECDRLYFPEPSEGGYNLKMKRTPIFISGEPLSKGLRIGGFALQVLRNLLEPATTGRFIRFANDTNLASKYSDTRNFIDVETIKLMEEERIVAYGIVNNWLQTLNGQYKFSEVDSITWRLGKISKILEERSTEVVQKFGANEIIDYYYSRLFKIGNFLNGDFEKDLQRLKDSDEVIDGEDEEPEEDYLSKDNWKDQEGEEK